MVSPSCSTEHHIGVSGTVGVSGGAAIGRTLSPRVADQSHALGILPDMPTAAGNRLRCEQCETEIIVVKGTDGEVSCCGQPMAAREG
jgi:alpha/beta superfamily hydrolase